MIGVFKRGNDMPTPIEAAAEIMADAFITKNDMYWSGSYAYQQAGGTYSEFNRDYCMILDTVAKKVLLAVQS